MKSFLKKLTILVAIILSTSFVTNNFSSSPTYAREMGGCKYLLGLINWDCKINPNPQKEDEFKGNAVIIASNVLIDLIRLASILVLGYVIYGGYLYMFSSGDPNKVTAGKKTLTNAFIGLAIVLLSDVILNAIRIAMLGANGSFADISSIDSPAQITDIVDGLISWVIGISGVVCVIFIIIGGISYMTSSGDPNKIQKAKKTILYACIGLAVVALAEIITAFVTNTITEAEKNAAILDSQTIIAKELYEK